MGGWKLELGVSCAVPPTRSSLAAEHNRDRHQRGIVFDDLTQHRPPRGTIAAAEQRDGAAVSAGAIHLPARGAVRGRDLDDAPRVGVHQLRVERGLRRGVVAHRRSERGDVAGDNRVAGAHRRATKGIELGAFRSAPFQVPHDLFMHRRRTVRAAEEHHGQPPLQLMTERIGQRQLRHDRARVFRHLDEVHAAIGGAELVLYAALPAEVDGLDRVRRGGDRVRGAPSPGQAIECAEQRDERRSRGPRRRTCRRFRGDGHVDVGVVWRRDLTERGLEQRVRSPFGCVQVGRVSRPVVAGVDDDPRFAAAARIGVDAHADDRPHGEVEHAAVTGEPGVGPAAVVTDAYRRGRQDRGHGDESVTCNVQRATVQRARTCDVRRAVRRAACCATCGVRRATCDVLCDVHVLRVTRRDHCAVGDSGRLTSRYSPRAGMVA